ncbi:hypothetical protein AVEN_180926-1 [Araneus ventricosus]|uniref:DUF7041 domain-containing protein n=1 Tax=Araneus ventricosus TaxID=182803 RepID=A0A4Y2FKA9_ARAVE|nr:hypothetical protein AVEN_180926-1 [Araneus ventricosus]
MPDLSPASEKLEASGVSIKIPPFWTDKPEIWFYQVEAQFQICKITSEDTKFNYLVAQLEPRFLENIWDIIKDSSVNKYSTAKERLLTTFKESENKKIKRLITGLELGDMMPSELLRTMRSLGEPDISEKVLRTLWLEKMPDRVKSIVIVSEESLEKLAAMADKIVEMNPITAEFAEVQKEPAGIDQLLSKISALESQIASMSVQRQSRGLHRHQRNRSRSSSRRRYNPQGKLCFFHFRFGKKCLPEKCVQPCSWSDSGNLPQQ